MPKSALSSLEVLRILNAAIGAKNCVYFTERDQTVTVQFTYEDELFTVAGVMRSELENRKAVNILGACLLAEANSMLDQTFEGGPNFSRVQGAKPLPGLAGASKAAMEKHSQDVA